MNVRSTTASSRKLKPFDALFLSTDDFPFSWLKDWLTAIKVRPGVNEKFEMQKNA